MYDDAESRTGDREEIEEFQGQMVETKKARLAPLAPPSFLSSLLPPTHPSCPSHPPPDSTLDELHSLQTNVLCQTKHIWYFLRGSLLPFSSGSPRSSLFLRVHPGDHSICRPSTGRNGYVPCTLSLYASSDLAPGAFGLVWLVPDTLIGGRFA